MLKFKGPWEKTRVPRKKWYRHKKVVNDDYDWYIPTVDEVDEVLAPMAADTVLQILRGQGIYWGYDCGNHADNDIREFEFDDKEFSDLRTEAFKQRINGDQKWDALLKSSLKFHYRGLQKEERKAIRLIAQINKIPLHEAVDKYLLAINQLTNK